MHFENDILGQLRNRRRIMLEIFGLAIFLGLLLNLFSNALYEVINDPAGCNLKYPFSYWIIFFIIGIFSVLLFFIREKGGRLLNFRIVLPVVKKEGHPHLPKIPGYAPTWQADAILQECIGYYPEEKVGMLSQLGLEGPKRGPGDKYLFQSVTEVAITLLLKMLKLHCDHTQTPLGRYHLNYSDIHNKLEHRSFEVSAEKIIGHKISHLPQRIKLPKRIALSFGKGKMPADTIVLRSAYATLEIFIQPHWTIITPESAIKTYRIATRSLQQYEKIALLSIPVAVSVKVHDWALWKGKETDNYCNWMEFLLNETRQWFSWEYFQEGEHERLLVELYEIANKQIMQTEIGGSANDNK